MLTLRETDDPILRKTALAVPTELFDTPELQDMLNDMSETLDAQKDGVALAAPQVGLSYRIFIVRYDRMQDREDESASEGAAELGIFINPEIIKSSRRREEMQEGCLSVRGIYGTTLRHERATVVAYDEHGTRFTRGAGGILAQAFQHETDHLDGMLFIDHAQELHEQGQTDEHQEDEDEHE